MEILNAYMTRDAPGTPGISQVLVSCKSVKKCCLTKMSRKSSQSVLQKCQVRVSYNYSFGRVVGRIPHGQSGKQEGTNKYHHDENFKVQICLLPWVYSIPALKAVSAYCCGLDCGKKTRKLGCCKLQEHTHIHIYIYNNSY